MNDYFNNQWTAREIRPERQPQWTDGIPPIWQKTFIINHDTDSSVYQADLKMYVRAPNDRFPQASCFMRFKNGRNSILIRLIEPIAECAKITTFLNEAAPAAQDALVRMKPVEERIIAMKAQINMLQTQYGIAPNGLEEIANGDLTNG